MAGRHAAARRSVAATAVVSVDDPEISRALDTVRSSVERLEAQRSRAVVTADLVIGTNKIRHGLGRAVRGYTITASVASAAFAHAIDRTNPRPELEVWITVVGTDEPDCEIEVY